MPRFHFNIRDGVSLPDPEGSELAGLYEARIEAVRQAGEIVKDHSHRIALGEDWHMEVADEHGRVLFRLDLTVVEHAGPRPVRSNGHGSGKA